MAKQRLLFEMVRTRTEAEDTIRRIMDSGHSRRDICVIVSEPARRQHFAPSRVQGAAIHGNALSAILAAAGARLVVPGLRLAAAGPIGVELADASSATASLSSALVDAGIPEHRAREVETGLKEGAMLIGVFARDDSDAAALHAILHEIGRGHTCGTSKGSRVFASFA